MLFHPLINTWFNETYGKPTAVQEAAWPLIEEGRHVLAIAPTGSGKTLTAFLSAISRFCRGDYDADKLSVLYISPLKALNEDIKRNLLEPLAGIKRVFERAGEDFPPITVETRSGDTPQSERRRFYRRPPSILVSTPESLALLLLNPRGRETLAGLRCLILDEIHSVLGTKRGSFLSCQTDRLSLIVREHGGPDFIRIGLSATVRPPAAAADFLGGLSAPAEGPSPGDGVPAPGIPAPPAPGGGVYKGRPVCIAAPPADKDISFTVEELAEDPAPRILRRVEANRTTLVFIGSRRGAEQLSYRINQAAGRPLSFAHHGSLSKELRRAVEQGLAEGKIPCVTATSSLELGIDIGGVDEVILAGSPPSAAAALQRIGRSGHGVGKTSVGRFIPLRRGDLLAAAALETAVRDREIETSRSIECPLDILAQIILALCDEKDRRIDELYALLRGFYVFRNLSRPAYDSVVQMLAGWGGGGRLRELRVRLYLDREKGTLSAAPGTRLLLYSAGGVIPSRGLYSLRLAGENVKIGELDEEFVWERRLGDSFRFGDRSWRITAIGHEAVEVVPRDNNADFIPFWRADPVFRGPVLSRSILEILDRFNREGDLDAALLPGFSSAALEDLNRYLDSQRRAQGDPSVPLPCPGCIPCEIIEQPPDSGQAGDGTWQILLHGFRGGALQYPLCLALTEELEERTGTRVESFSDDNTILFLLPGAAMMGREGVERLFTGILRGLGGSGAGLSRGERQFTRRLESSSRFGAAFREAAERSLTQPRGSFGKRLPLWVIRQKAKRLFDTVRGEGDFPLTAEAWRSCLQDDFDMKGFRELTAALASGAVAVPFFRSTGGSPFARNIIWQETNTLLYQGDERKDLRRGGGASAALSASGGGASLSDRVIAEALGDPSLRPVIPQELAANFAARLRRELPGWAPEDSRSLAEWVKERIAIPADEWETLLKVLPSPLAEELKGDPGLGGKLRFIKRQGAALESAVHREWEESWLAQGPWRAQLLCQWLRFQGPLPLSRIGEVFGWGAAEIEDTINALDGTPGLPTPVPSVAVDGLGDDLLCDAENLELLLRLKRAGARAELRERPAGLLVPFLALRQGISPGAARGEEGRGGEGPRTGGAAGLGEWAAGCALPVQLWETEVLPAREKNYRPESLDEELREGRLLWYGAGKGQAAFCRPGDLDLTGPETGKADPGPFPPGFFERPRDYWEIKDACGAGGDRVLIPAIWEQVWKGRLSSDSWEALRRAASAAGAGRDGGSPADDTVNDAGPFRRRVPKALQRGARNLWKRGSPLPGRWFSLELEESAGEEPWYEEELDRERVRLLLRRWGLLCRPLLERENGPLSWARLLPAMRRMELAGELAAGYFFSGIRSLQFASPAVLRDLEAAEEFAGSDSLYWINAADPASPAALDIEGLDPRTPARSPRNRLYYRGARLIAVSKRNGKELEIYIPPEDSAFGELAALIMVPRRRNIGPEKKLVIETINGGAAGASPYGQGFAEKGFIRDRGKLYLW
ncbi:MAG: DEAD/DEAH box helicase [Treponema sp.]|jgi:ATP-dependent Lhr-like helicase|nr:DEAD/DEAH box helicase [Treponema sp.]